MGLSYTMNQTAKIFMPLAIPELFNLEWRKDFQISSFDCIDMS